jgi:hypothetical protein
MNPKSPFIKTWFQQINTVGQPTTGKIGNPRRDAMVYHMPLAVFIGAKKDDRSWKRS